MSTNAADVIVICWKLTEAICLNITKMRDCRKTRVFQLRRIRAWKRAKKFDHFCQKPRFLAKIPLRAQTCERSECAKSAASFSLLALRGLQGLLHMMASMTMKFIRLLAAWKAMAVHRLPERS